MAHGVFVNAEFFDCFFYRFRRAVGRGCAGLFRLAQRGSFNEEKPPADKSFIAFLYFSFERVRRQPREAFANSSSCRQFHAF